MSVNRVIVMGRLGKDPELSYTPGGAAVCKFSLATSEKWKDKSGQWQERTEWFNVVVWGKQGESCGQYLAKGRQAYIEGRLQTRTWEDKKGQKRYTTEINASSVVFIGGQGDAKETPQTKEKSLLDDDFTLNTDASFSTDDIPF